jgi:6-phosphogluconolactonase (cycloisomerase 2 family)
MYRSEAIAPGSDRARGPVTVAGPPMATPATAARRLGALSAHLGAHSVTNPGAASTSPAAGVLSWLSSLFGSSDELEEHQQQPAVGGRPRPGPTVLVGTYTDGSPVVMEDGSSIRFSTGHAPGGFILSLDPATGSLTIVDTVSDRIGSNPAYTAHDPATNTVYFTNETEGGCVKAYSVDSETGELTYINELPTGGDAPCFLTLAPGGVLLCANYSSGHLTTFTTAEGGALAEANTVALPGRSDPPESFDAEAFAGRQEAPHAHCFVPDTQAESSGLAWACDLGSNEVVTVEVSQGGEISFIDRCKLPAGTGPRHLALTPDGKRLVVGGELGNNLCVLDIDREERRLVFGGSGSLVPDGYEAPGTGTTVSHVELSPLGQYAFVGNRIGVGIGGDLPSDM